MTTTKDELEKANAALEKKVAKLEAKLAEHETTIAGLQAQVETDFGPVFGGNAIPLEAR